jgi:hypothetical protein
MVPFKPEPGVVIGSRYRLEHLLGEGAMGAVWAAENTATGERCAVKLIKDGGDDPELRKRFLREGRAASAVRHPNVVDILDVIEPDGEPPAIVMALLHGESLRARLERVRRLTVDQLAEIMVPVVSAIGAAHALGIVHRDLKPENLFLARGPADELVVKVLDFGIAKLTALDGEAIRSTGLSTNTVLGTPMYMAPEQVFAERDLDHRADIWALGIIFYECLSGSCPTRGDGIGQILKHVVAKPFDPLRQVVPGLPEDLAALVDRMLARNREERPADLREVLDQLAPHTQAIGLPFGRPVAPVTAALGATLPLGSARDRERVDGFAGTAPSLAATVPGSAGASDTASITLPGGSSAARSGDASAAPPGDESAARSGDASAAPPGDESAARTDDASAARSGDASAARSGDASAARSGSSSGTRHRAIWAGAAVVVIGAVLVVYRLFGPVGSPLDGRDAVLACPILGASGVDAPAGWLGAAAAAIACERARLVLGGRTERTLVPAELLDLPRGPTDAFPADPYGRAGARDRSLAAAAQRAQAYLDGDVGAGPDGFTVTLSLRRADRGEIDRAVGRGRGLYEAVRSAMTPLIGPGKIPRADALDPAIAAWARTSNVDDALGAVDLGFGFAHNAGDLPAECKRFDALAPRIGELGLEGQWLCGYTLGQAVPRVERASIARFADPSPAAVAIRIRIDHVANATSTLADAERLHAMRATEPTARGRAQLAAIESCVLTAVRPQIARDLALLAVQSEPKNPEGGLCNSWEQLIALDSDTSEADATWRAMQAWAPWNSYAWLEKRFTAGARDPDALPMLRRAYALSPFDTQIAGELAGSYIARGDRAGARGIALALRGGGLVVHEVGSELLAIRVDISEARFRRALEAAQRAARPSAGESGWARAQRFEIAWHAFELGVVLGRGRELADWVVAQFLDPEPTLLDGHLVSVPMRIPAVCVYASAPDRCFARFRSLRGALPGAVTPDTDDFMVGAERYAARDYAGAAQRWRPLLTGHLALGSALPDALVEVFERTGSEELAVRVDDDVMKRAREFNGATLGHVRAARRAFARRDPETARRLAEQVIAAWSLADDQPPALAEMRRLVAQIRGR